ncbi:lantibiotic dehydratase [Saccharothrix sp. AJ9571]|nr:lantibiotic dehydratase [Saccharothrix sp. AJ9571]
MDDQLLWRCAPVALVRAPVHPAKRAPEIRFGPEVEDGAAGARRLSRYVRECVADPLVREAVAVSSPALLDRVEALDGSSERPPDRAATQRMARALTAYRLRMATRATPFGLMAGVAVAEFAADPADAKVRFGTDHRRAVRPDLGWLLGLVVEWEKRLEVLRRLRVTVNTLCAVRGGRVVLPYVPILAGVVGGENVDEVSVRHTPVVRTALRLAGVPTPFAEVEAALREAFPGNPGALGKLLLRLVECDILLTGLRPPLDAPDPLDHILGSDLDPTVLPELAELRAIRAELDAYADTPLGDGHATLRAAGARMRALRKADHVVQVDLALDAEVRLPQAVAEEAERAADLLWRLSPGTTEQSALSGYHADFVERYGLARAVPVKQLLDPELGLGAPAGYRLPRTGRHSPPIAPPDTGRRDRVLATLAHCAGRTGAGEVVLTDAPDDPVTSLLAPRDDSAPVSAELFAHLVATDLPALQAGRFHLVVSAVSGVAGAAMGRFTHLLPEAASATLRESIGSAEVRGADVLGAQISFQPVVGRSANVAQVPRLVDHQLPVGTFADRGEAGVLDVERLAVRADRTRLFLVDTGTGRRVAPSILHMLNPGTQAPNLARFLHEIQASGRRPWGGWDWGAAEALPYLPRVRYGRSVLSRARWRPDDGVRDQREPFHRWADAVRRWRDRLAVPDAVRVAVVDHCLDLDLTDVLHLHVLRHALREETDAVVYESLPGEGTGWLAGPEGGHHNEIVFPLVRRSPAPPVPAGEAAAHERFRIPPPRPAHAEHLPGGHWAAAALYCSPAVQNEVLSRWLPHLLAALPAGVDRWFYLRYRDDRGPHLRLRFHGEPQLLGGGFLPLLHDWAAGLRAQGLAGRLALDTYDPELERYGGPEAMEAAERAFHADSVAAVEQVRLLHSGELAVDPVLLAAANVIDLLRAFWTPDGPDGLEAADEQRPWEEWLLRAVPKELARQSFQRRRREAIDLLDPDGVWTALEQLAGGSAVRAAWAGRAAAVAGYGRVLHAPGPRAWAAPPEVLLSLFHMHHNRLIGSDEDSEKAVHALARGVVQARRDRRRHAR